MGFTKEDFTKENAQRLTVIINHKMLIPPLTPFFSLAPTLRTKFNRILNEYVNALPDEWETTVLTDFNTIVNEDVLNEDFEPSKQVVPILNTDRTLLLTEEQKEFLEQRRIELNEEHIRI